MRHVEQMAGDQVPVDRFPGKQSVYVLVRILERAAEVFGVFPVWVTPENEI